MGLIGNSREYFKGKILTADTNYHSNVNMQKCVDEGVDAYFPDRYFRTRDPRFVGRERHGQKRTHFALEDLRYDEKENRYICPNGKRLRMHEDATLQTSPRTGCTKHRSRTAWVAR